MIKHSLPCYKFSRSEKATAAQKTKLHGSLPYLISGVPCLNKWFFSFFRKDLGVGEDIFEGLPGVLGNKGTLAKYRREQRNISQFLGTGEQNSKNYSTKTF